MKTEDLEEFLNMSTEDEKLDDIMKKMMEEKFDSELKDRYSNILKEEYDLVQQKSNERKASFLKRVLSSKIFLTLALLLLLGLAYLLVNNQSDKDKVEQYIAQNTIRYQETTRNEDIQVIQNKIAAYLAFNKAEYESFLELIDQENKLNTEDRFFVAYSKMKLKDFNSAATDFEMVISRLNPQQKYYNEAQLYLALCYLNTNKAKFNQLYDKLEDQSWSKKELDKILS